MKFINKLAGCFLLFIGVSAQTHAQGKPIDLMSPNGELKTI